MSDDFAAGMRRAAELLREKAASFPVGHEQPTRGASSYNWFNHCADAISSAIPAPAPWTPPEDRPDYPNDECPKCGGEGVDADPHGLFDGDFNKPCPSCWPAPEAKP